MFFCFVSKLCVNIYDVLKLHFFLITSYHIYIPIELINFTCKENKEEKKTY